MFELDIEMLKEQGMQLVDSAKKTAQDLAGKGKNQLDLLNQQARLSKAQRQLGALVYSLHKAGEENQPLVDKYIEAIAEIEKNIEEIKANMAPERSARSASRKWTATRCSATTAARSCNIRRACVQIYARKGVCT